MSGSPGEGDGNLGPLRVAWRAARGPAARALLEADERVFVRQVLSTPCLEAVVRAEGPWLVTADGARILDFHGNSVHQLGHGHPAVVEAVIEALRERHPVIHAVRSLGLMLGVELRFADGTPAAALAQAAAAHEGRNLTARAGSRRDPDHRAAGPPAVRTRAVEGGPCASRPSRSSP